jgi:hypothetical protein
MKLEKLNQLGKECSLRKLSQFLGMRVEVSINTHTHNNNLMCTYFYESFDFDAGEFILCLFDKKDETLNTRINNELILEVKNLTEDLYDDVIHIYTNDFILSITTLEQKLILPKCNHCGKEIEHNEYWLSGAYGDLRLCEDCSYPLYPISEEN